MYYLQLITDTERRLRHNLRKTKALLKDTGNSLHTQKTMEGTKSQINNLKNQVFLLSDIKPNFYSIFYISVLYACIFPIFLTDKAFQLYLTL